ncbi:MAG: hypothetical protein JRJ09_09855 [Deltaproteobacteria bacterium]|nr:hypothetical protein [Deltaproteobacteria bacterium]MBW2048811.1 hypothetical protein [Deltaproteobacteria bacterium]MBW2111132.1 hypothetical protein [Deltaproteobacteria bacterium]MBW2353089.1 hypothetical protein [Deltaproteobacteria bacterium]HDZ89839.1 hypothetical protein [Deltaproteobacteria bacterium]
MNRITTRRTLYQVVLLLTLVLIILVAVFSVKHVLRLPFRDTNDTLHREGAAITLDFLIPGGTYIDQDATIGDVVNLKLKESGSPVEKALQPIADLIPAGYRYLVDILLFFFWTLSFLTLFRVFTFMGYARALRISLLLGGLTYYFMPDFSPGSWEDAAFVGFPVLVILARFYLVRRKREKKKVFRQ